MQTSATATNSTTNMLQQLSSATPASVATSSEHQQAIDRALALSNAIREKQKAVEAKSALLKIKVDELQAETSKLTCLNVALEKARTDEFDINVDDSDVPLFQDAKRALTNAAAVYSQKSKLTQDITSCSQIIDRSVAKVTEQNQQLSQELARVRDETAAMKAALARSGLGADNQTADTAPRRSV